MSHIWVIHESYISHISVIINRHVLLALNVIANQKENKYMGINLYMVHIMGINQYMGIHAQNTKKLRQTGPRISSHTEFRRSLESVWDLLTESNPHLPRAFYSMCDIIFHQKQRRIQKKGWDGERGWVKTQAGLNLSDRATSPAPSADRFKGVIQAVLWCGVYLEWQKSGM